MLSKWEVPCFLRFPEMQQSSGFEVSEPEGGGAPRRWYKPWRKLTRTSPTENYTGPTTKADPEPILKLAATAASPTDGAASADDPFYRGATLFGYRLNTEINSLSTNKSAK